MIVDEYAPIQKLSKKDSDLHFKPWLTPGILKSIQIRKKLHKKLIKTKNTTAKTILESSFKIYRNIIANLTRQSKKNHFQNYFAENTNNIKKTWEGINNIIKLKSTNKISPTSLMSNNKHISDPKDITNGYNMYFTSIASNIENKLIKTNNHFSEYLINPNPHSIFLSPIIPKTIQSEITALKNNKALGPNSIPTKVLKYIIYI